MRLLHAAFLSLATLAPGCAGKATTVSSPPPTAREPVAAVVVTPPAIAVREVAPAVFADPQRRAKIEARLPAVRELVARSVEADRLVGLAVGIVVDGELVLGEGFGVRHADEGGAVDARTAFRIGSITKVFTAMTALRLAERGRIDLDAPAAALLPELDTLVYPSADARRITVRDLLTHTSGLPRDPDVPPLSTSSATSRDELMRAIDGLSLVRPPGVAHEYSNLGFSLLGHLVAAASGRPYHDAIDELLLAPLAMRHTVWEPADVAPERLAMGHEVEGGRVVTRPPTQHGALDAAGGLYSTVDDLARFVAFQLAAWPPRGGDDGGPLSRATLREAHAIKAFGSFHARTRPVELAAHGVAGGTSGVGLGFTVSHGCEHPHVVGHNGGVDGHHATVRMLPHAGVGVIVLGNAGWADTDRLAEDILRALEEGGGLKPRAPQASPELTATATRVTEMLPQWDEAAIAAASTLALRPGAQQLGAHVRWMVAALGACRLGPLKQATSAWSGVFRLECERGRAELTLALNTAREPKIAGLRVGWLDGTPSPEVQRAASEVLPLLERFDEAKFNEWFSPRFTRTSMERLAAIMRFEYGACRLGRALEVSGPEGATFALACDKREAKLSIGLERGAPRIVSFRVVPGPGPACH